MSEFNKKVGKEIAKAEAEKLINNWKKKGHKTHSNFFGSELILRFLNKPGAVGIRIHYGEDDEAHMKPVITPEIDSSVASTDTLKSTDGDGTYGNTSLGCPPYCPK
jgi:hypothetical protein